MGIVYCMEFLCEFRFNYWLQKNINLYKRENVIDSYLWLFMFIRFEKSIFICCECFLCCVILFFLIMIFNVMFYGKDEVVE